MDSVIRKTCDWARIPITQCSVETACTHRLNLTLSACSQQHRVVMNVSATNALGTGPPTTSTIGMCGLCVAFLLLQNGAAGIKIIIHINPLESTNTFVSVNFNKQFTYFTCKFHGVQPANDLDYRLNCSIVAGPYKEQNSTVTSDTVIVEFNPIPDKPPMMYDFIVSASNGTFTILVEGTFRLTGQCPKT